MIKVKVCGLTDARNAMDVAESGVDYLGFNFYSRSKRFVGKNPAPELVSGLPGHVRKVGVFVNEKYENILNTAKEMGLDTIQLHGNETTGVCRRIRGSGLMVVKSFGISPGFDFNRLTPFLKVCDNFLFDTKTMEYGGSGIRFPWDILKGYDMDMPFFLSGGIGPEDVARIKNLCHKALYGVDINSRFETSPGIKNIELVKNFTQDIKTSMT